MAAPERSSSQAPAHGVSHSDPASCSGSDRLRRFLNRLLGVIAHEEAEKTERRPLTVWLSRAQLRMFTARATTSPTVSRAATDWMPMTILAVWVSGIVSVGLNAVALVSEV